MSNRQNTDTIFNNLDQETFKLANYLTPPQKKIFIDSHLQYPKFRGDFRSGFQTPSTRPVSSMNSEKKPLIETMPEKVNINAKIHQEHKPCNCRKSQCLKLYCDCFAAGALCTSKCSCVCCVNNVGHLQVRNKQIDKLLETNPEVFNNKITKTDHKLTHAKGCNCRKSGCQKKYCECFNSGIACSLNCKCDGCKNCEDAQLLPKSEAHIIIK